MKKGLLLLFVLAALMLAACGGQETPEPTDVPPTEAAEAVEEPTEVPPTEEPAAEPTAEPTAETMADTEVTHVADPELIDITWAWVSTTTPVEEITVENPASYTAVFNEDGTVALQADCNNVLGEYTTSEGSINIVLGPTTAAACGEASQDQQFLAGIGAAAVYFFQDGDLYIDMMADGGTMRFTHIENVDQPGSELVDGIPEDAIQMDLQGLAETFQWEVRPAQPLSQGPGAQGFPPHILVTFDGQSADDALANSASSPHIFLFPKQAYIDLYNAAGSTAVADQVTRLEELIGEAETRTESPADPMPLLPPPSSFMGRWVQFSDLNSGVGPGVRYVSDSPFRQAFGPWTNDTTGYYYEGLSEDGVFYISAYWPVATESLPNTEADVPEDVVEQATNPETAEAYQTETKATLNALAPEAWQPSLTSLDALIGSLTFPTAAPQLTGITWEWVATTTPVEEIVVEVPGTYTILFNEDGTANVKADCNNIIADYTTDGSSISIVLGPTTQVACANPERDTQFTNGLTNAAIYFFEGGELYMDMFADGGTMRFVASDDIVLPAPEEGEASGTITAPDGVFVRTGPGTEYPDIGAVAFGVTGEIVGVSEDGEWWAINVPVTPESPDGIGWISAQFVDAVNTENVPVITAADLAPPLAGVTWEWVSLTDPAGVTAVADPSLYTILFNADGSANVTVDCNNILADYTVDGSNISIALGPSTLVACANPELDAQFTNGLTNAAIYFFEGGELYMDMVADGGTLRFRAAGAPQPSLTGTNWQWVSTTTPVEVVTVNDPTRYTILFNADGTAAIQADCNSVAASYTADGGSISIVPGPTTLAACPSDSLGEQFVAELGAVAIYFFQNGELYMDMMADSGTMRFQAGAGLTPPTADSPSGGAEGVQFALVSYGPVGNQQALLPGTTITATFSGDQVSGSAGCNDYNGTLTPVNDYFTVGPIATTRQTCAEPAGIMEQEQAYLTALEATSGYNWAQEFVDNTFVITAGELFYTLPDGNPGVLNFVSVQ